MIEKIIIDEIITRAAKEWPDDKEMQSHCFLEECEAFLKLQRFDFDEASHLKSKFIANAKEHSNNWSEIYYAVETDFYAYLKISKYSIDGIPPDLISAWKKQAAQTNEEDYAGQLSFLEKKAKKYLLVRNTRQQVDPIKNILIELEEIIGNECYNSNIKNYESWGRLESEGRKFRYPVKFHNESQEIKRRTIPNNIPSEELITGHYSFGANELNIFRALFKIVLHLQEKHGLKL